MDETIYILEVHIDNISAKRAMKRAVESLKTPETSVIEFVSIDTLMEAKASEKLKTAIEQCDMVLPGETEILKAAGIHEKKIVQEVKDKTFSKMFLKYLHKNHYRVYLLAESTEELENLSAWMKNRYKGIQVVGESRVSDDPEKDDLVVNSINGSEADCVIATLEAPVREAFVIRNRSLINTRVWFGIGKMMRPIYSESEKKDCVSRLIERMFFRREAKRERKPV